ncbi:MAG: hypothetical protein AABZ47_17345 [Planctomycetota bacterium]
MVKRLGPTVSTLILLLGANTWSQERPTFSFLATAKNGEAINPPSASIDAVPGDIITVEAYVRCWSNGRSTAVPIGQPSTPTLAGYNFAIDYASLFNEVSGNVLPVNYANTTALCQCELPAQTCPDNFANAFVTTTRSDFVFAGRIAPVGVATRRCNYRISSAHCSATCITLQSQCPPRTPFYCGTVRLQVSGDAAGTFNVCFDSGAEAGNPLTRLIAPRVPPQEPPRIEPLDLECLTINVPVDNCPGTLVGSDPPSQSIDAREPSLLDDATPIGTDVVTLTFPEGDYSCLKQSSFSTDVTPPGDAPFVEAVAANPNHTTVEVFLSGPLPAGKWTRITHEDGTPSSVRLGYLPLDVNGDSMSNAADLLRLMDCLESKASCTLSEADLDRSGSIGVMDIARGVDLHNGAGAFAPWGGASLPPSPP